jgi:hypothetical protein
VYTQLDALNYILSQVGAAPVDDLDSILPDLASAQLRFNEANVWVQKRGWWFNQILRQTLTPDPSSGEIALPGNTLKIESPYPQFLIAQTDSNDTTVQRVFDPINNVYVFEDVVCVDVTLLLDFEYIPLSAQDAVIYRAAAAMVQHELEDMNKYQGIMQEFTAAYSLLRTEDLEIKQRHSASTPAVQRMMRRVRPYKRSSSGTVDPAFPGGRGY